MRLFEQELPVVIDSGQFDSGRMANWIDKGLLGDSLAHVLAHDAFQGPSLHPPRRNSLAIRPQSAILRPSRHHFRLSIPTRGVMF
jgi:hypothetical protein